jgi:hypothetical protein
MIIFDARNVRATKARPLFNVALTEFLFLAEGAKTVAHNHGGIDKVRLLEGKQGVLVRMKPSEHHVLLVK